MIRHSLTHRVKLVVELMRTLAYVLGRTSAHGVHKSLHGDTY